MLPQSADRLKALILILMAIFFAQLFVSGRLFYYIGPRFSWLCIVAICLFIVLAGAYKLVDREGNDTHHDHEDTGTVQPRTSIWSLLIPALPLILAVIIPSRPLGATAALTRGVSIGASLGSAATLNVEPSARTVLDWARAMSELTDPAALDGQSADVVGFVYRDVRFAKNQFMVARFTITCCVADALAIGVVVNAQNASQLTDNSWVHVKGTFAKGELDGKAMPILTASDIAPVQPPEQPYLYP